MPRVLAAQVVAEFTILPFVPGEMHAHVGAGVEAAERSGLSVEVGPFGTRLTGNRSEVLSAVESVINAALDAGAAGISLKIEAAQDPR